MGEQAIYHGNAVTVAESNISDLFFFLLDMRSRNASLTYNLSLIFFFDLIGLKHWKLLLEPFTSTIGFQVDGDKRVQLWRSVERVGYD